MKRNKNSQYTLSLAIVGLLALAAVIWHMSIVTAESPPEWPTATPGAAMTAPAPVSGYPAPPPVEPYPAPYPPPGYPSFLPAVLESYP